MKIKWLSSFCITLLLLYLLEPPLLVHAGWHNSVGTYGFEQSAMSNWCWAASAKNCAIARYSYPNVTLSQSYVVNQVKGSLVNEGASLGEGKIALSKVADPISNNRTYCYSTVRNQGELKSDIDNYGRGTIFYLGAFSNNLVIARHAVLFYAYRVNSDSIMQVKIFEPSTGDIITTTYNKLKFGTTNDAIIGSYRYIETIGFYK